MRAHQTFRLSNETKDLLRSLASLFDATLTATVTRLVREEAERRGFLKQAPGEALERGQG